jgi:hypothetical protein
MNSGRAPTLARIAACAFGPVDPPPRTAEQTRAQHFRHQGLVSVVTFVTATRGPFDRSQSDRHLDRPVLVSTG